MMHVYLLFALFTSAFGMAQLQAENARLLRTNEALRGALKAIREEDSVGILLEENSRRLVQLTNSHFKSGTFVANEDNVEYILQEDIIFNPLPENDNHPIPAPNCGDYCGKEYEIGFFAVMAINAENVVVNLNGKTMKAHDDFVKNQRFMSIIELGATPFLTNQGPNDFGAWTSRINNVVIRNGKIGLSSHHGIHGNNVRNILIKNVDFEAFEVAAIHLNGVDGVEISDCNIDGSIHATPALATLSEAQNLLLLLEQMTQSQIVRIQGRDLTVQEIKQNLQHEVKLAKSGNGMFALPSGIPDGSHMAGIILHGPQDAGVAIHNFRGQGKNTKGLKEKGKGGNVKLKNVQITNLALDPKETVFIHFTATDDTTNENLFAPHGFVKGPFGDVMQHKLSVDDDFMGTYEENSLTDAMFAVCRYAPELGHTCSTFAWEMLTDWIGEGVRTLQSVVDQVGAVHKFECNRDAMDHFMKGLVGIRLEDLDGIELENILIQDLNNQGVEDSLHQRCEGNPRYVGGDTYGIVFGEVKNVKTTGAVKIYNLQSHYVKSAIAFNGNVQDVDLSSGNWVLGNSASNSDMIGNQFFTCPMTGDMYVKVNWVDTQDHNSCPMKLCSAGQKETPACKYDAWTFHGDGRCENDRFPLDIAAPEEFSFDGTYAPEGSMYHLERTTLEYCGDLCLEQPWCAFFSWKAESETSAGTAWCYISAHCELFSGDNNGFDNDSWKYDTYIITGRKVRWSHVGYGGCTGGNWRKIGTAGSLDEAKALMLADDQCNADGSILFYSAYSHDSSWSVRCATAEHYEDCTENNPNWQEYIVHM